MKTICVFLIAMVATTLAQRSPYAGRRPIGYPELSTTLPADEGLGNRFGDDDVSTTTMKLPIEALGDSELVKRLLKLPQDQQPFWLLNWQALEANRRNPQTLNARPNPFLSNSIRN